MKTIKIGLLGKVILAIVFGIGAGLIFPDWLSRIFITFNGLFSNFLGFIVPMIILGLIAPGIADLGKSAGKLLIITSVIAYGFTIITGLFAYFSANLIYPSLLDSIESIPEVDGASRFLEAYFTLEMPPLFDVMGALILSFILGLGMAFIKGDTLKKSMEE